MHPLEVVISVENQIISGVLTAPFNFQVVPYLYLVQNWRISADISTKCPLLSLPLSFPL